MSRTTKATWKRTVTRLRRNARELELYGFSDGFIWEPANLEDTPLRPDGTPAIVEISRPGADANRGSAPDRPEQTGEPSV